MNKQGVVGTILPDAAIDSNVLSKYVGLYPLKITIGMNGGSKLSGRETSNFSGQVLFGCPNRTGIASHTCISITTLKMIVFLKERILQRLLINKDDQPITNVLPSVS